MINYLQYLNVPTRIGLVIIAVFMLMQIVGKLLEFKGKVVPEILKVRKVFARKKKEKKEVAQTLKEVRQLLGDVNSHYSADNIAKRDGWMNWVNDRGRYMTIPLSKSAKSFPASRRH